MPRQRVAQMKGIRSEIVPPQGAKMIGTHTDGRPIFQETRRKVTKIPLFLPEELPDGEEFVEELEPHRKWRTSEGRVFTHQGNGVWVPENGGLSIQQARKRMPADHPQNPTGALQFNVKLETETIEYVIDQYRTGHNVRNRHFREDPETLRERRARREREAFQERLATAAVERGLSADEIIDRILDGGVLSDPVEGPESPSDASEASGAPAVPVDPGNVAEDDGGPDEEDSEPEEEGDIPFFELTPVPPGGWKMPDGEVVKGTKEAAAVVLFEEYGLRAGRPPGP